jgi:hypothetical protein
VQVCYIYSACFTARLIMIVEEVGYRVLVWIDLAAVNNLTYQYNETNVMHFLFNLLRIKGLYMFRALLAHPLEVLHKRHLVYCLRVMSVGCGTVVVATAN